MQQQNKKSQKQIISEKLIRLAQRSTSLSDLEKLLNRNNIDTYRRRGKFTGIRIKKRKYRLTTLGIDKTLLKQLTHENRQTKDRTA